MLIGKIPLTNGYQPPNQYFWGDDILTSLNHNWTKSLEQGPGDIGFDTSYITAGGIQSPPYAFYRNDMLDKDVRSPGNIRFWSEGDYSIPQGRRRCR